MEFNKRGDIRPISFLWLGGGIIFLLLGIMPFFNILPFSFELTGLLLKYLIVLVGLLIFVESFGIGFGASKFGRIIIGVLFVAVGLWFILMHYNVLESLIDVSDIILQILLIVYSIYLIIGAFLQE